MREIPPLLGIFNDVPWFHFRESEAHAWARAGFSWVVNDGEHSQWEGYYGREQNATLLRLGITPVQRLPREAISLHGDALQLGARATMRPYATIPEEAETYFRAISFPDPSGVRTPHDRGGYPRRVGRASTLLRTPHDRGGYPMRRGDRTMEFSPSALRAAERDVQGWLQFETPELITDRVTRDHVLDMMSSRDRFRACGFIGPFDAVMRGGEGTELQEAIGDLLQAATDRNIPMGRLVSPGSTDTPAALEEAFVRAIENGARLLAPHVLTSDLPYRGAAAIAEPFFRACERCGF